VEIQEVEMLNRSRLEQLRDEIELVASEIDDGLLKHASPEAKEEWEAARTSWRGAADRSTLVDEDLSVILTKVRRFGDILRHVKRKASLSA
jgi:hypothetical protein